jgi:hypothetical protein
MLATSSNMASYCGYMTGFSHLKINYGGIEIDVEEEISRWEGRILIYRDAPHVSPRKPVGVAQVSTYQAISVRKLVPRANVSPQQIIIGQIDLCAGAFSGFAIPKKFMQDVGGAFIIRDYLSDMRGLEKLQQKIT